MKPVQCPSCQRKNTLTRTGRPFYAKYLLFFLPLRAFKCQYCKHQTLTWKRSRTKSVVASR